MSLTTHLVEQKFLKFFLFIDFDKVYTIKKYKLQIKKKLQTKKIEITNNKKSKVRKVVSFIGFSKVYYNYKRKY